MRQIKIALVNDTVYPFSKGGAQKRVYEIAKRLVQRGHEVHWYGMDCGKDELEGIRMHKVSPAYKMYTKSGRRVVTQAIKFAMRLNIKEQVDVIDCMNFPYLHCFPAKLSAVRLGVPLVITWFEFWGDYWHTYSGKLAPVGIMIEKLVTKLPDMIIADSEKVKMQLVGVKAAMGKIRVVPDGVDIKLIRSVEPSKEKCDVVFVGRMLAHKNLDVLLRTLAEMKYVTAVLIGDGESRKGYMELSRELRIDNRIKFTGYIEKDEDVFSIMKSAKVLVLPSTQEGHPLVIPEANACGIPVVAIDGVCDEFIEHGWTGYLSPMKTLPMKILITKALELYPKFRIPCETEAEKYDWEIITDKVEAVYEEMVSG